MNARTGNQPIKIETSEDAALGGRLVLRQPLRGHRFGHDAILLAAATAASAGDHVVELGAGVGAAGLALTRRIEGLIVTLVDIDPDLTDLARHNAERNGLGEFVRAVCLDVAAPASAFAAARLAAETADCVLMNPPFNPADNPSAEATRRRAHVALGNALRQWVGTAARLLRPAGALTLIWRADGLAEVLAALASDFGAMSLLPVYGRPGAPAIRIIVRAIKGNRAPLTLHPGLLLTDADGKPTGAAEAVLRRGAALPWGEA
jgi:tRNA1(Val) A37 N6-methylase TrmN6